MKHINQKAKKIMDKLTEGLTPDNSHKKIDNSKGAFMPVVVEYLREEKLGSFFSVTHYYEQNGDAMRDPDMEFLRANDGQYYPAYFRQDGAPGMEQEVFIYGEDGEIKEFRPRLMNDLKNFSNIWMENIRQQQGI
jgi:hypothetical protein